MWQWKFNYVCYTTWQSGTTLNGNKYECDFKYHIESVGGGKEITTCLSKDTPCPKAKKRAAAPDASTCPYLRKITTAIGDYYKCTNKWEGLESIHQKGSLTVIKYCLTECPFDK